VCGFKARHQALQIPRLVEAEQFPAAAQSMINAVIAEIATRIPKTTKYYFRKASSDLGLVEARRYDAQEEERC
jgi:hypothetical protein